MTYKLKDEDKIEVQAGDLRGLVDKLINDKVYNIADVMRIKYYSAFEEAKEEWEDVTDRIMDMLTDSEVSNNLLKIENNRIWRKP